MRRRKGRALNGVVLLDKPTGMSSNDVLQKVKRLYQAAKAGHTGALDPLATGMLPICFGEATKFSQFLLDSDKRYRVIARLGQRTDTSDSEGQIIEERPVTSTLADIETAIAQFRGTTQQVPSMFSALKYQGRPLYEYARQGLTVPREARDITVYQLILIRFDGNELELDIHCSKGTYIRTIIDDLGEMLGCGAHVIYLRRTEVAKYPEAQMVTLDTLQQIADDFTALDHYLLPVDSAVADYPIVLLNDEQGKDILLGRTISILPINYAGLVRIKMGQAAEFLGMGHIDLTGQLAPKRLIVTETH